MQHANLNAATLLTRKAMSSAMLSATKNLIPRLKKNPRQSTCRSSKVSHQTSKATSSDPTVYLSDALSKATPKNSPVARSMVKVRSGTTKVKSSDASNSSQLASVKLSLKVHSLVLTVSSS